MTLSRRTLLIGATALPFLHKVGFAQTSQHLRIGLSAFPPNLTPWTESGAVWKTVNFLVHRGLLSYSPDGQLRGEIAEKWDRVGDTGWRFTLRNALFSNGSPITRSAPTSMRVRRRGRSI